MVDALVSIALDNLARLATHETKLVCGTKVEVDKLSDTLTAIQASLQDAAMRQFKERAVQEWLNRLQYVAYEVDDALDEWNIKYEQLSNNNAGSGSPVWNFLIQCTCFQQLILRHNMGKKIQKISKKLDQIANEKNRFNFHQNLNGIEVGDSRITSSCVDTSEVFGREDAKEEIKHMLISEDGSDPSNIAIISIVGMGGYGKTTLAQFVFNDDKVKHYFDELIWVCVSDEFDVAKIVKKIIEAIKKESPNATGLEALQKLLWDNLTNKRFLLILDDVWNEDYEKWEKLNNILKKCGAKGSKIVVTTRLENVALLMRSIVYPLGPLSDDDCWAVFKIVAGIDENECSGLVKIGREIVTKCKGTPLAIKTVAAVLRTKRAVRDWESVLKTEIWDWPEVGILPALLLSYYHLSPPLKWCFRYCSIFPKDYEIKMEELVNMWVAQGYISYNGKREIEDIGKEYFEELLRCSLFQMPQRDDLGNITKCKMHDMVHDLAQFVTNGESTFIDGLKDNSKFNSRKLRHCTWIGEGFDEKNSIAFENLRTFVAFYDDLEDNSFVSNFPLEQLRCIRVLSLHEMNILKLPESIGKLVHLRYLELSDIEIEALPKSLMKLWNLRYLILRNTRLRKIPESIGMLGQLRYLNLEGANIEKLPESITDLCHLQVLDLNDCEDLCKLPSGIQKMTSLKRLRIASTNELKTLPAGIGKLTSLEKLDKFILTEGQCSLNELRDLNNLQGSLSIENLEVGSRGEAVNAKLEAKSFLQGLELTWSSTREEPSRAEGVLEALRPHPSLRELTVSDYPGSKFPSWVGESSFSSLVTVLLRGGPNCTELPALGNLPQLRDLSIRNMPKVRKVGREFFGSKNGYPKLKSLRIWNLENWEEWDSSLPATTGGGVGRMPCLCLLAIHNCVKLQALPPIFSEALRTVEIEGSENMSGLESIPPSVEKIVISCCPGELISKLPSLPKLEHLKIVELTTKLPFDLLRFSGLKTLELSYFSELRCLPEEFMNSLKGLQELCIHDCPQLEGSCKMEVVAHMPCVRRLQIWSCENLKALPRIASEALKEVDIRECPNLSEVESIPASTEIMCVPAKLLSKLPSLPMLNHLEIEDDEEVTELSNNLIRFTELQTLEIVSCKNLRSFPEEMSSLKKLRELIIFGCPNLTESCEMGGEQWSKIAHIPRIEIDDEIIQDYE